MEQEINEELFKTKQSFLDLRSKTMKKILSKGPEYERRLKYLNLNFNPENYKYKELVPTEITDKYYLLEQEYKKQGIPYSPFLLISPEELQRGAEECLKKEDFDYYKQHILQENYDEEPEFSGQLSKVLEDKCNQTEDRRVFGYTKWFDNEGRQSWKKCEITGYNENEKLFSVTITIEKDIKYLPPNTERITEIRKKVTRFNILFEGESLENLERRVRQAEKWKYYAQKYLAFYHFVSGFNVEKSYDIVTKPYIERLLALAFLYRGINKKQSSPIEIDQMENSERFGIWRRHAAKRVIEVNKKKLMKFIQSRKYPKEFIENLCAELRVMNERSYKLIEFYKTLPLNYNLYQLLREIIPKEKFLMASERYLHPTEKIGTISFLRHKPFLEVYQKIEFKLHQSEKDNSLLLIDINKKLIEELQGKLFFSKHWIAKPISIEDFRVKNEEAIQMIFKEINFIVGHSNYEIISFLRQRKVEVEKVNKGAKIPQWMIKKFQRFQNLLNRKMGSYVRETFHRSMEYLTNVYRTINETIKINQNLTKTFNQLTIEEILKIRDNYHLAQCFHKQFDLLQFSFELKYDKSVFFLEPNFIDWWEMTEQMIHKKILKESQNLQSVMIYELLSKEEQDEYYKHEEAYLKVFYPDDLSYMEEIKILHDEMKNFFSIADRFLEILNIDIKSNLTELMNFSKEIKSKNFDEDLLNIGVFRYWINFNKKYLEFFEDTFKDENFFLGGFLINISNAKEIWITRLKDIKEQIIKLMIDNNIYLSKKMETEREAIEKRLEEEPQSVDEYEVLIKYSTELNEKMKGIWENINSQQENAELLEENFFELKKEDFYKMWGCYGIPRLINLKKQDTMARLTDDKKKFKKDVKEKYLNTLVEISKIKSDFETNTIISDISNLEEKYKFFSSHKYKIESMIKQCKVVNEHQIILGIKASDFSEIHDINKVFLNYFHLWESVYNFETGKKNWMEEPLKKIDRKALKNTYETCINTIDTLEKTVFRKDKPSPHNVILQLREEIKKFTPVLPVLYDLINPDFKPNHIGDLSKAIDIQIPEDLNINMTELVERGILTKCDEISDRSTYATGQKKLNATLEKVREKYKSLRFDYTNFKQTDLLVLKDVESLTEDIESLLTKIVAMSTSKYAKYLLKDIHFIWGNFSKAQEIIDIWLKVQKLLTQLHQIFIYGDIKKQLQEEFPKYEAIEKSWRHVMDQVRTSPHLSEVIQITKLKDNFIKSLAILEEVNKSLIAYLNTKRDAFPRFYFVSNEELTLMLAQSSDPSVIAENYIQHVFEGIKRLNIIHEVINLKVDQQEISKEGQGYDESRLSLLSADQSKIILKKFNMMSSEQGENVPFLNTVNSFEEIPSKDEKVYKTLLLEKWLGEIEKEMQGTLKSLFMTCYQALLRESSPREDWAGEHIEQAVLTISQLDWTNRTSKALLSIGTDPMALKVLYSQQSKSLLMLIKKIRQKSSHINKLLKKTLVSLIIQDVHANDVIQYLIDSQVTSVAAFEWVSQLRYYFVNQRGKEVGMLDEAVGINVRMLNTKRAYDFEYIGNQKRLVITPLTDRCYRTMMEALSNSLGGAPEGPAGTGKTETIKDLSKNFGKKCFTYNCSEESDYILMTKFFKGIAMSGCWVCFDEFNRISLDCLSVISHQISILLTALRVRVPSCTIDGASISFNFNMGIFITMNPDYAGRSELPDNLKGLFRPLAMMIPNYDMITEIMLYSFGFNKARVLSKKIVSSLRLASEQLSSQFHYDYGMRALNGIINYIGILSTEKSIETEDEEEYIVQKAIRDSNMPKFIADDYKIYEGILSDLFPNGEFKNQNDPNLVDAIKNQMKVLNLVESNYLLIKVIDLINIMSVRHAIMIVGAPMANKSSILKLYLNSMPEYFKKIDSKQDVKCNIINPKSITSSQLFGYVNKKSMEFFEGVCSKILRDYFTDQSQNIKILTFDGPVDTMWIENMNSVLDDTKKLCLENSDQIRLDEKTFIMFEVDDLSQASLATISRCGMVFTDRVKVNPNSYFQAWLKSFPEAYSDSNFFELITNLFESYYDNIVNQFLFDEYSNLNYKIGVPVFKNWLMRSFIQILECLLFHQVRKEEMIENEKEKAMLYKESSESEALAIQSKQAQAQKAVNKRLLNKNEKSELFNKFIYALIVTFCWILENSKDQKLLLEKIFSINKELINSQTFAMKEELFMFSKNYMSLGKDFIDYIYNLNDNSFNKIQDLLASNSDNTFNRLRECFLYNRNIMIPSVQTYKAMGIVKITNHNFTPLLLYGSTATGKSLLIKEYLNANSLYLAENNWMSASVILNSKTNANNLCDLIEEKIYFKLKKNTLAPPNNKNCIMLIEDLNMPVKEKYGAQPPIEILRQYFDYGGWYDRKEKDFLYLKNLLIYSCLTLGRPLVSSRLLWHYVPFPMNEIEDTMLKDIFTQYFNARFFDYTPTVRKLQDSFVELAIKSYKKVQSLFRPLPVTPHYNFNLRDLNKIFEGLAMTPSEVVFTKSDSAEYMASLFLHETMRVYNDRLVDEVDRQKFKTEIFSEIQRTLLIRKSGEVRISNWDMLLFSEINDEYVYQKVDDPEKLKSDIYQMLEDFNYNKKTKDKIELILFDYSLKHLLRIDRILSRNSEHAVLIGLTGSGRQSLCNVAAYIKKYKIYKTRTKEDVEEYGHKEWLKDIQELYINAGVKREPTIFLLKDINIPEESMYVDLNCIISSGIVYNLFSFEEKAELNGTLKLIKEYDDMNLPDEQALWDAFIVKTMQKCRVILCMNPLNPNFTKILRSFPALINNTTIDWYELWPESALFYLAEREIGKLELDQTETESGIVQDLADIFSKTFNLLLEQNEEYFKNTRKKVIILPKSYLDFINFFKTIYAKKTEQMEKDIKKYSEGVKKIDEAGEEIKKMTALLEIKRPQLVEQSKFLEATIKEIDAQTKEAQEKRIQCEENEKIALARRHEAEYKKTIAEYNKQEAEAIKEEIYKKIMLIDKKQFMAVRSYRVPPKEITKMMGAISLIMSNFEKKPLEVIPKEWEYYKKKLNDVKLLTILESLPKKLESTLFQEKILALLEPLVKDPDIEPSYMEKRISSTCACFCHFIRNMFLLDDILKTKIIPSTRDAEEATASFNAAQESLDTHKRTLLEIEDTLQQLTENYNIKNLEQQELDFQIKESEKKLSRAQRLTGKLSGEQKRWLQIAEELKKNKVYLFGDIVISAIYISFMGPFLNFFRENFIRNSVFPMLDEKHIQFSRISSIGKIIGDPYKISDWMINGLPPDSGSVDNGVILFETLRPCLLIDPQKQAVKFFSKMYKNDFVIFKKQEVEKYYVNTIDAHKETLVENCVKNGKVLIFDYISFDVPPEADSLINSEEVTVPLTNNSKCLKFNEGNEIPLHPMFKYYLISYLTNPTFNPELYGRISIINFSVTRQGLNEQLLSVIVKEESPSDEAEKIHILQKKYQLNDTIHKQEEEILARLSLSSETLLDNDSLIVSLEESKKLSDEASFQIISAKATEERIDKSRLLYMPLAELSTLIFFAINELSNLEHIYQFSIGWYIKDILVQSLKMAEEKNVDVKSSNFLQERIEMLSNSLLKKCYDGVCRSLLNKDKIVFAFLLLIRKLEQCEEISEEDTHFLFNEMIKSTLDENTMDAMMAKRPDYIDSLKWNKIVKLNEIQSYKGICMDMLDNAQIWKEFISKNLVGTSNIQESFSFPNEKFNSLNNFKKLLLLKILNPESVIPYSQKLISQYLSEDLCKAPLYTLGELYEMSSYSTPIMLIITPGLDPTNDVIKIAEENEKEIVSLSLGQGQGKKALNNIELCQKKGIWVFLQNLHLVPDFMKSLEQVINSLQSTDKDINIQFRLWLSALPSQNILPSILVNSLKTTIESPSGVKANLAKLMKSQEKIWQYEHESMRRIGKDYEFTKFFLCLMHFHSIILERKNYGPIGWNIKYNFNESDFLISKNILRSNLEKSSQVGTPIPYKAIIYLTAECIYGGRVTDDWDRRTLSAILNDLYSQSVLNDEDYLISNLQEYSIPYLETFEAYSKKLSRLPDNDPPEVMGLHRNTLIRKQIEESKMLIASFAGFDKGDSSGLLNKTSILASIVELANKRLIKGFNIDEIKKKFPLVYEDCMNSILIQEIMRYNSLLSLIFSSLDDCAKVFLGHLPLTDEIEEMTNQITASITPTQWIKASYPTRKPIGSWIVDLEEKIKFFNQWLAEGLPKKFWLSAFFFTQSFLTGIKQNFARKYKTSIDKLEFNFDFADNENYEMEAINRREAYYIFGLYIEGAEWNSELHCVDELRERTVCAKMPAIILSVKVAGEEQLVKKGGDNVSENRFTYQAPVYKCSSRHGTLSTTGHSTNYIFTVDLPSLINPNHWIKRGVALLNQQDD